MLGDARVRWWMATPSCRGRASKRGENQELVTLSDAGSVVELQLEEILELDTARALGVSTRTVSRDWLKARLFLLEELAPIAQRLL